MAARSPPVRAGNAYLRGARGGVAIEQVRPAGTVESGDVVLAAKGVTRVYDGPVHALGPVDLEFRRGEFLCFLCRLKLRRIG